MANQKPVDEIRIGRVKATDLEAMEPRNSRGTMSPFPVSTKTAINGRVRRASGATILLVLAKVADLAHTRLFQLPTEAELPEVQVDES